MVTCDACGEEITVLPILPLTLVTNEDGSQGIKMNWNPVYRHMRDNHPETWTTELADEYAEWSRSNGITGGKLS